MKTNPADRALACDANDDLNACAEIVRLGDPDRFLAIMAAPPERRGALFAVFAFNSEVARAPWVSREPIVCEMRLQWWADRLAEIENARAVPRHHVLDPLSELLDAKGAAILGAVIEARRRDIYTQGFADAAAFETYLQATSGGLLWGAARALGVEQGEHAIRDIGYATGLANWFRAVPDLVARGHRPLVDDSDGAISSLARGGLARLRNAGGQVPKLARYATRTGWQANRTLRTVAANPAAVSGGRLHNSEFIRRSSLMFRVLSGAP